MTSISVTCEFLGRVSRRASVFGIYKLIWLWRAGGLVTSISVTCEFLGRVSQRASVFGIYKLHVIWSWRAGGLVTSIPVIYGFLGQVSRRASGIVFCGYRSYFDDKLDFVRRLAGRW